MANPMEPMAYPIGWRPISPRIKIALARSYLGVQVPEAEGKRRMDFLGPVYRGDAATLTLSLRARLKKAARIPQEQIRGSIKEVGA